MFKKLGSIILRFYRPEFNDGGSIIPRLNQSRFNQSRQKGTAQDGRASRGGNSSIVSCEMQLFAETLAAGGAAAEAASVCILWAPSLERRPFRRRTKGPPPPLCKGSLPLVNKSNQFVSSHSVR